MISFNKPPTVGTELLFMEEAIKSNKISGDGKFTKLCNSWFEKQTGMGVLLTTSGTHAIEMAALLLDIKQGDEVIMPSYTFVSTANAFVLRGATIVFIDIRPDTMNIDESLIEAAITDKTKAVVAVHYAGVSCDMDVINAVAKKHNIAVVEDAAQGVMASYKGKILGTLGDFGCYSFHETKNFSMGEGGALLTPKGDVFNRAEIIREKGTNRSRFFRGEVDKYSWVDVGSSYLPSDLNAAYLYAQLLQAQSIIDDRKKSWDYYYNALTVLEKQGFLELPKIPQDCVHNGHMFYIKLKDLKQRTAFNEYVRSRGVHCVFHYIPLHSSEFGVKCSRFEGEDIYTTKESERLTRLPLYYNMELSDLVHIVDCVFDFFSADK